MTKSNWRSVGRAAVIGIIALTMAASALGQGFTPFYGKNKVKWDKHRWQVYRSPHFEVYYYPEFEQELGRLVSYAESAYEKVSNDLKHEISFRFRSSSIRRFPSSPRRTCFPSRSRRASAPSPSPRAIGWSFRSTIPRTSSRSCSFTS